MPILLGLFCSSGGMFPPIIIIGVPALINSGVSNKAEIKTKNNFFILVFFFALKERECGQNTNDFMLKNAEKLKLNC